VNKQNTKIMAKKPALRDPMLTRPLVGSEQFTAIAVQKQIIGNGKTRLTKNKG